MGVIKKILTAINAILLIMMMYVAVQLIEMRNVDKTYKSDYATLHSVEYGMFNSDIWTSKVTQIIDHKITTFNINTTNREEIKSYIETILDTLILEADRAIRARNKGRRGFFDSLIGSTKQMVTDTLVDIKDLRKRVPEFTNAVMAEVEKPENQQRYKIFLREKIREFMNSRLQLTVDMSPYYNVLKKYDTKDLKTCNDILNTKMHESHKEMHGAMLLMLTIAIFIILFTVIQRRLNSLNLFILSGTTVSLLITGIMLPMLDIEAKISKFYFIILDNAVEFENQLLFFQSKSIYDLVRLLMESDEARMILVGVLLVMFSIIFPTLKLISTYMYYYSSSIIGNNPVTRFFALKSTKWSMADVFVVSIFMSYLGLDGVVDNQMKRIEAASDPINIITTNGTHLQVGFFLFLGFVFSSFVLSMMVESKRKKELESDQ